MGSRVVMGMWVATGTRTTPGNSMGWWHRVWDGHRHRRGVVLVAWGCVDRVGLSVGLRVTCNGAEQVMVPNE